MDEQSLSMNLEGDKEARWYLELVAGDNAKLPFTMIAAIQLTVSSRGWNILSFAKGALFIDQGPTALLRFSPMRGNLN